MMDNNFILCDNIADANAVDLTKYKLVNELTSPGKWVFMVRARKPVADGVKARCLTILTVMKELVKPDRHMPVHHATLCQSLTMTADEADEAIAVLMQSGELYEPKRGWYSLI
jgi:hypothetical protein